MILLKNIFLSYQTDVLFDNLNVAFAQGKITCLLGPSGVEKSTLLKLIAGLIPFQGHVSTEEAAYMPQIDLLQPWLTAFDNALLGHRLRGAISNSLRDHA